MTRNIHFTKMHGAGNDYIYVDATQYPIADPQAAAIAWSDRHKGIGSDGIVLIGKSPIPEADFTMRIFNADGSEAMMCGNASRCIGKYLYEKGFTKQTAIRLLTLSGIKLLNLQISTAGLVESVMVDMGKPLLQNPDQFVPAAGSLPDGTFVCMGNPHYVIFVKNIEAIDVAAEGSRLEIHSAFPQRANIEFAEMRPDGIRVRVWERGSGITLACGTGACATAVAAIVRGRVSNGARIIMDGGELDVSWQSPSGHVMMTGGADFVFEGDITIDNKLTR
ncbi:MAG: diaminopimelate epimerase [Bacteroidaceae bacterium]|nr:diaminopimelate epimerase [Bacteroidaceae bacterium]